MKREANFSPCRKFRYTLWRVWGNSLDYAVFVGLNPSTADEVEDDPTIRRCIAFVKNWGYSGLCMTNLFAFRATKPADMMNADDPVGPDNDKWLCDMASQAAIVIAAWGMYGTFADRHRTVRQLLPRLHYLRLTKHGHPRHPLYLPKTLQPTEWCRDVSMGAEGARTENDVGESCH